MKYATYWICRCFYIASIPSSLSQSSWSSIHCKADLGLVCCYWNGSCMGRERTGTLQPDESHGCEWP